VGVAVCQDECCTALVLSDCALIWKANLHWFAVPQGCCQPGLQSSTRQWVLQFAGINVAVHWWWVTAHLYGEQSSTGAFAVPQSWCQPGLQSSTEQWVLQFAGINVAVHWCWVTAHLYGKPISTGVLAVPQGCFQPGLQSSTGQWVLQFAEINVAVHWCWATAHLYGEQSSTGAFAVPQSWCQPGLQSSTVQCQNECCTALVLGEYGKQISTGVFDSSLTSCCQRVYRVALSSGCCSLPECVSQCVDVGPQHNCVESKAFFAVLPPVLA